MASNQLTVVTPQHPAVEGVVTKRVAAQMDTYLEGTELTGLKILTDMMVALTENPKLQNCSRQSLYKCALFAAKHKRSFGPYGVWMVPRDMKDKQGKVYATVAVPQLAYQSKNTSARERGAFIIQSEVVLKGEAITIHKDGAIIQSIDHEIDYFHRPKPTPANVVGAYGVVQQFDGRRFHKVLTKHDIDRSQSAAASKSGPWATDYEAMVRKTVEARMQEDYVGDFTQYGGGIAAGPPPSLEQIPESVPGKDLATEFFEREAHYEPTQYERAQAMVETARDVEAVDAIKSRPDWPDIWNGLSDGERKAVATMAKARKAELQQQNDAGGDEGGSGAPPASGQPTPPASSNEPAGEESASGEEGLAPAASPAGPHPAAPESLAGKKGPTSDAFKAAWKGLHDAFDADYFHEEYMNEAAEGIKKLHVEEQKAVNARFEELKARAKREQEAQANLGV